MGRKPKELSPIVATQSVKDWLDSTSLNEANKGQMIRALEMFLSWITRTKGGPSNPDDLLKLRQEDLRSDDRKTRFRVETWAKMWYNELLADPHISENTAAFRLTAIRSFFAHNRYPLVFARGELKKPKVQRLDYIPTKEDVRRMCEVSNPRDASIIIVKFQTGMSADDMGDMRVGYIIDELNSPEPTLYHYIRGKTGEEGRTFLGADSKRLLKIYLNMRRNRGEDLTPEKPLWLKENGTSIDGWVVEKVVKEAAKKAGVGNEVRRMRAHCLRKAFQTLCEEAGISPSWVDVMMAHVRPGTLGHYSLPTDAQLREAYKKAEPLLSISEPKRMNGLTIEDFNLHQTENMRLWVKAMMMTPQGREALRKLKEELGKTAFDVEINEKEVLLPPNVVLRRVLEAKAI
jgi:integrase